MHCLVDLTHIHAFTAWVLRNTACLLCNIYYNTLVWVCSVINEAIRTFLKREDVKNIWEKYSNLKHVANDLVAKGALMDDEYFAVCDCKTHIQVNQCLWSMYYRNPDQKKLQVLARALQADQSHSNNCKLGSMIEEYCEC